MTEKRLPDSDAVGPVIGGNVYDKYGSRNPVVRALMAGFFRDFDAFFGQAAPETVIEAGCGEGVLSARVAGRVRALTAFDIDSDCVRVAESRLRERGAGDRLPGDIRVFQGDVLGDLPDLAPVDLVICCEVLEHVGDPEAALDRLKRLTRRHLIVSVPREPLWRVLNMARLKYLPALGNTPGHVQHWSARGFEALVARHFEVIAVRRPLPWTMILARTA